METRGNNNDKVTNDQMKKFQEQIKASLEPFVQDIKKLSETNINSIVQNIQNIQNVQGMQGVQGETIPSGGTGFKGPIPLPVANNDWSQIK